MDKINVLEYSKLKDFSNYETILKHLKPKNKFNKKEVNIFDLPFSKVKIAQALLSNIDTFDKIYLVYNKIFEVSKADFYKSDIEDFYSSRRYILETFESINKKEIAMLNSTNTDTDKWKASGGDRLQQYSTLISVDGICERYGLYPFEVVNKPYHEIFYLQCMLKDMNEVNFNYNKP